MESLIDLVARESLVEFAIITGVFLVVLFFIVEFSNNLTYINSQAHISRLENLPADTKHVILRFRSVHYMDPDGIAAVAEIVEHLVGKGKEVYITGLSDHLMHFCKHKPFFEHLVKAHHVLPKTQDALAVIYKS